MATTAEQCILYHHEWVFVSECSSSPGPHPLFLLVGFDEGPWQTVDAYQIWSHWLHLLRKYKGICLYMTNSLFVVPFGGIGVTYRVQTSSIARWKARSRLRIRDNWTFFASSYSWCSNTSKSPLLKGWVTLGLNIRYKGYVHHRHIYTVT